MVNIYWLRPMIMDVLVILNRTNISILFVGIYTLLCLDDIILQSPPCHDDKMALQISSRSLSHTHTNTQLNAHKSTENKEEKEGEEEEECFGQVLP